MTQVGDRVELITTTDEWTRINPGTRGTVRFIDSLGTVHVDWDDGHKLGLVREAGDRWNLVSEEKKG